MTSSDSSFQQIYSWTTEITNPTLFWPSFYEVSTEPSEKHCLNHVVTADHRKIVLTQMHRTGLLELTMNNVFLTLNITIKK